MERGIGGVVDDGDGEMDRGLAVEGLLCREIGEEEREIGGAIVAGDDGADVDGSARGGWRQGRGLVCGGDRQGKILDGLWEPTRVVVAWVGVG